MTLGHPAAVIFNYRFLKNLMRMNCMRRWRIHGNNIVYYIYGIALPSFISLAEFKVHHNYYYIIILYNGNARVLSYPAFLECENNKIN
jgi:hypothetical protein